jgi:hypothetical protein
MMTHPDELFELAKSRLERNQRESRLANAQACLARHWLAERVRRLADRLDAEYQQSELAVRKQL